VTCFSLDYSLRQMVYWVRVPFSACEQVPVANGTGSRSKLLLIRADIRSGSPGASPFLGSTIRKKLWVGVCVKMGMSFATRAPP
jgi:hypothetical protein